MGISDILGGILSSEPVTRVYTRDSVEDLESLGDNSTRFYTAVLADVGSKFVLIERLHDKKLSHDEIRKENIALDILLTKELKQYDVPFKDVKVYFSSRYLLPEYIKEKYTLAPVKHSVLMLAPLLLQS